MIRACRSRPIPGGLLLAAAAGLLLLAACSQNNPGSAATPPWVAPQDIVDSKSIRPATALLVLAGESEAAALDDTLAQGDWATAFALLAYSPVLSDTVRVGNFLLVASRLETAKQTTLAAWGYRYVIFTSVVSPSFPDLTRVQNLLQAGAGLRTAGSAEAARLAVDRADLIAAHSPTIPGGARAIALRQVADAYSALGAVSPASQARQAAAQAAASLGAPSIDLPPALASSGDPPVETGAVRAALQARISSSRALADAAAAGKPPARLVDDLAGRLLDEDGTRLAFYDAKLKTAPDARARANILQARLAWLTLKWRIARGGLGLSVVPEWEGDVQGIETALSMSLGDYFQQQEARVAELAPAGRDAALESVLRSQLLLSRLGFDRGYDEAALRGRIEEVTGRLRDAGVPDLLLDALPRGPAEYLLVPDQLYGQGDKALPR